MTGTLHRYPGIRAFSSEPHDRMLFQGRERESKQLLHLVLAERLVVLYARSGMGKSSLIAAGVTHPLETRGYCVVNVRFNDPETRPLTAMREQFGPDVERQGYEFVPGADGSLWGWLKTCEIWDDDTLLEPVLILDQFEELFTLHDETEREQFITQLAQVVRGIGPRDETARHGASAPKITVLLSMREDFLGHLEELAHDLPAIFENRFRIEPLSREQAANAIVKPAALAHDAFLTPPFAWSDEAVERMLDFLASGHQGGQEGTVEPFQLQLICQDVERNKEEARADALVTWDELGGDEGLASVMDGFYQRTLDEIGGPRGRKALAALCEDGLITKGGRRLSLEESDIEVRFGLGGDVLARLVDRRLLRREPRVGSNYYELSHDTLVKPVLEDRSRRQQAGSRRRTLIGVVAALVGVLVSGVGATLVMDELRIDRAILEAQRTLEDDPSQALLAAVGATGRSSRFLLNRGEPSIASRQLLSAALNQSRIQAVLELSEAPLAASTLQGCPDPAADWRVPPAAALAPSPTDELIAVGGATGVVWLLDFEGQAVHCTAAQQADTSPVTAVSWSPRGHRFASVNAAGITRVWTLRGEAVGEPMEPMAQGSAVQALALDPLGEFVAVGTEVGDVHVGSVALGRWVASVEAHLPVPSSQRTIEALAFSEERSLLSVGADGRVAVHQLGRSLVTTPLRPPSEEAGTIALSQRADVAAFLADARLYVSAHGGTQFRDRAAPSATAVAVDPSGTWIAHAQPGSVTAIELEAFLGDRLGPGTSVTLPISGDGAQGLVLGEGGEVIYVTAVDGSLSAWDLLAARRGGEPRAMPLPPGVRGVPTLSRSGEVLAAQSPAGVTVWAAQGQLSEAWSVSAGDVTALGVQGAHVLVADSEVVTLHRQGVPEPLLTLPAPDSPVRIAQLDGPVPARLLLVLADDTLQLRDARTGALARESLPPSISPSQAFLHGDEITLADTSGRVVSQPTDGATRSRVWTLLRDDVRAPGLATADFAGAHVVVASAQGGVVLLGGGGTHQTVLERPGDPAAPSQVVGGQRDARVLLARADGHLTYWDERGRRTELRGLDSAPGQLALANGGDAAVAYSVSTPRAAGRALIFDLRPDGAGGRSSAAARELVSIRPADPAARWLVSTDGAALVQLWDGRTNHLVGQARACTGSRIESVAAAPDGSRVAAGCDDDRVEFFDPLLEPISTSRLPTGHSSVRALTFVTAATLFAGDAQGRVHRFERRERLGAPWIVSEKGAVTLLVTGPTGQVAAVSSDGTIAARLHTDGPVIQVAQESWSNVAAVAFSDSGTELVAAGDGNMVRGWSLHDGKARLRPKSATTPAGGVVSVGLADGDTTLFASDRAGRLHLWRFEDSRPIGQTAPTGAPLHAWPRADGTVGGATQGVVGVVYEASWRGLMSKACDRLTGRSELRRPETEAHVLAARACKESARWVATSNRAPSSVADNYTPLMHAAAVGHHAEALALLEAGASPNETDAPASGEPTIGETALHLAAGSGRSEILVDLLERGADPGQPNALGVTPLMRAAWVGHLPSAKALLDATEETASAFVQAADETGSTAMMRAAMSGQAPIIRYLHGLEGSIEQSNVMGLRSKDLAQARLQGLGQVFFELDKLPPFPGLDSFGLSTGRLWGDLDRVLPEQMEGVDGETVRAWMSGDSSPQTEAFVAALRSGAQAGDDLAATLYGLSLQHGWSVPRDAQAALQHLRNAAFHGFPLGQLAAGVAWWEGLGGDGSGSPAHRDFSFARVLIGRADDAGLPRASAVRGILAHSGRAGSTMDRVTACGRIVRAATKGDPLALTWLASGSTDGRCRISGAAQAMADFDAASSGQGWTYPPAAVDRVAYCIESASPPPGCEDVVRQLRAARSAGEPRAPCLLARIHLYGLAGQGIEMDKATAMLSECIASKDPWAPSMLGWLVEHDDRVTPDDAAACRLYDRPGFEALRCYKLGAAGAFESAILRLEASYHLP